MLILKTVQRCESATNQHAKMCMQTSQLRWSGNRLRLFTRWGLCSASRAYACTDPLQRPLSPPLALRRPRTQTTIITLVFQAQRRAIATAANNSQTGRRLRGREGGGKTWQEICCFHSCLDNNHTPGESLAVSQASLFTVKMICRAPSVPPVFY